jgi:hypothetical protein
LAAGRSAAWLAHLLWEQEVGGSNPPAPTVKLQVRRLSLRVLGRYSWDARNPSRPAKLLVRALCRDPLGKEVRTQHLRR